MLQKWPGHASMDVQRVGAFGMSMGRFTVLTAIGAQPDLRLISSHCARASEFVCQVLAHFKSPYVAAPTAGAAFVADPRIKAAVLAAPGMGFALGEHGLDQVHMPIQL